MDEDQLTEHTYETICAFLKKYPKKRGAYNDYCKENKILDLSEMPEWMAQEVFEILDSGACIRMNREKEQMRKKEIQDELCDAISYFLEQNKDTYIIVDKVEDCYLLAKKIYVNVESKNDNNIFQPHKTITERFYLINFLVRISDEFSPNEMINRFIAHGCRIVKINHADQVEKILSSIT